MVYQYWVVRYVPNVARGEFTNIGIVCGIDGGDWASRFDLRNVPNPGALRADLRELGSWVRWFERRIAAFDAGWLDEDRIDSGWMNEMRDRQANAVQLVGPTPIAVESALAGVELLYPHLVERTSTRRRRRGLTRTHMRNELRDTFTHELGYRVGQNLFRQPTMVVGSWHTKFDLGRRQDGTVLTNTWTFNGSSREYLERDIGHWNYIVSRFRTEGAQVVLEHADEHLSGSERIEVVFDAPDRRQTAPSWREDVFEAALESWRHEGVIAVNYNDYLLQLRSGEFALH